MVWIPGATHEHKLEKEWKTLTFQKAVRPSLKGACHFWGLTLIAFNFNLLL